MNRAKWVRSIVAVAILFLSTSVAASVFTSNGTGGGNWNQTTTWTPNGVPGSLDTVFITGSDTVTITDAQFAETVVLDATGGNKQLVVSGGGFLTISGTGSALTINPASSGTSIVQLDGGTIDLTTGDVLVDGGSSSVERIDFNVNGGLLDVAGALTFSGTAANAQVTFSGITGTVKLGSNLGSGGSITSAGSTFEFDGTANQTIGGPYTLYNVIINKTAGIASLAAALTINNNLDILAGTLEDGGNQITMAGGLLSMSSGTFFKIGSSVSATTFPTGIPAANVTLSSGSTIVYKAALSQAIEPSLTYQNLSLETPAPAVNRTYSGLLVVDGDLSVGTNVTLNVDPNIVDVNGSILGDGTITLTTGSVNLAGHWNSTSTLNAGTGTVTYDGTLGQLAVGGTYHHLVINKTGGTVSLQGATTVNGDLTLNAGTLSTGNFAVSVTGNITTAGTLFAGTSTITLYGDWTNTVSGGLNTSSATIDFSGTAAQTFTSVPLAQFGTININNTNGVTIDGANKVMTALNLNAGNITSTGTYFAVEPAAVVTQSSGYVIGQLTMGFNLSDTRRFWIGTAASLLPVDVTAGSAGYLEIEAVEGQHPSATGVNMLDRFWSFPSGSTVVPLSTITFNYNQSDFTTGDETLFGLAQYDGGIWTQHGDVVGEATNTATLSTVSGYTGDWVIGQRGSTGAAGSTWIIDVNSGSNPGVNVPFDVIVDAEYDNGSPANVSAATSVSLSVIGGTGTLGGTTTGTINAGTSTATISGVTYDVAELVTMKVTATAGDPLVEGDPVSFSVVPTSITVLSTADSGAGTLRDAITTVNGGGCATPCTIQFASTGTGTISLSSALPAITTNSVTIDGYTGLGASANTNAFGSASNAVVTVILDGGNTIPSGLEIQSDSVTVSGLAFRGFTSQAIAINGGSQNKVAGCLIGTDGSLATPNYHGVVVSGAAAANNSIGGTLAADRNVISGNTAWGVILSNGSSQAKLEGNYIGVNAAANTALANGAGGVQVDSTSSFNAIGTSILGNVVSGHSAGIAGIELGGANNFAKGNFIGTDGTGLASIPNAIGINVIGAGNSIGGTLSERNIISGNNSTGIAISGDGGTDVANNYIGVNASLGALGNGSHGISSSASGNRIGVTNGNVIANNGGDGVTLTGTGVATVIQNNAIYANTGQAIDLDNDGVTLNDPADADSGGANNGQNFPTISYANIGGGNISLLVSVDSSGSPQTADFIIDVFKADTSSPEEALEYLGSSACLAGPTLTNTPIVVPAGTAVAGDKVVVTATSYDSGIIAARGVRTNATCSTASDGTSELSAAATLISEKHWIAASGNWENAANWNPSGVPASTDDVYIDASGTYTVTINTLVAVNSLHVGVGSGIDVQTLDVSATNSLSLSGASDVTTTGALTLNGNSLSGAGTLDVYGVLNWPNGTIGGTGMLSIKAGGVLNMTTANTKVLDTRTLAVDSTATANWTGGTIQLQNGGTIVNSGTFEVQANSPIANGGAAGPFNNFGTVHKSGVAGTTNFNNVTFSHSAGTVDLDSGVLELAVGSATAPFDLASGTELLISTSTYVFGSGSGTINGGSVHITGGPLDVDGASVSIANLQLDAGGVLAGIGVLSYGTFTWNGGTMTGTGTTQGPSGSTLTFATPSNKTLIRTLNIQSGANAAVTGGGSIIFASGGNINNAGTWDSQTNHAITDGGSAGAFTNTNIFRKSAGGGPLTISVAFNHSGGTVELQSGSMQLYSGTSTAAWDLTTSSFVSVLSAYTLGTGTSSIGAGYLEAPTGTLTITGTPTLLNFILNGGTLDGTGTLTVTGSGTWGSGTMQSTGATSIASGASFAIGSASTKTLNQRALSSVAGGTINWTGGPIAMNNGATINNAGLFHVQADDSITNGGTAGAFTNTGTLRKSITTGTTSLFVDLANTTGIVDVQSGVLSAASSYSQGAGGKLQIHLNGTMPGTQHGQLMTAPSPTLAGTLEILLVSPYQPIGGDTFRVVTFTGAAVGDFTQPYTYPPLTGGRTFADAYDASGLLLTVIGDADLSITKTATPTNVIVAGAISYTLTVINPVADLANSVVVTDTLPTGHAGITASGTGWNCNVVGDTVTCTATSSLGMGNAPAITINATAPTTAQSFTNTASVSSSNDSNATNNSANANVTVSANEADVSLSGTAPVGPFPTATPLALNFTVNNGGPQAATNVTFTSTIPTTLTYNSATIGGGTCNLAGQVVTCTRASLSTLTFTTVTINVTTATSGTQVVPANVTATEADSIPANNSLTYEIGVTGSTVTVVNTNEAGTGSLRQALLDAQNSVCTFPCSIDFNIPAPPYKIQPLTNLPSIISGVTLDATTQPGYTGTPIVEVDGTSNPASAYLFQMNGTGSVLRGFSIINGAADGVNITGDNNKVESSFVGLTPAGIAAPNANGIRVLGSNNTIGGANQNIISGNTGVGVVLDGVGTGNIVATNFIGTDPSGTSARPNDTGITITNSSDANTIGGALSSDGNLISGNATYGIHVQGAGTGATTDGNTIRHNWIGPDATGNAALGAGAAGIAIDGEADATTIDLNAISGNQNGITVSGTTMNTVVTGNLVGVAPDTTTPMGNPQAGIVVSSSRTVIGGTSGASNVIANNGNSGVIVLSGAKNEITGNSIFNHPTLGIDLNGDGIDVIDAGDADAGANNTQNAPTLTSAVLDGGGNLDVTYSIDSSATSAASILAEFFEADSGTSGEGLTFLGRVCTALNAFTNTASIAAPGVVAGDPIVTTATGFIDGTCTIIGDGTSEFSTVVAAASCTPASASVSGTQAICTGGSATISATLTGTAPFTVNWSDGFVQTVSSGTIASRSVSPASTTTYTVTSVFDSTCATAAAGSGSAIITVNPQPTATVSGTATICAGGSATISATLTGTAPFNLTWSDGFVQTVSSGTTATRSVTPSSTTTYTITTFSDATCAGTSSGSAVVTVNPLPTAIVSGTATICAGSSTMISATLTGTAPFNLTWSDGFVQTISSGTTATRSVTPSSTTTYTITSFSDTNCTGTSSGSAVVTVNPQPTAVVSGSAAICAGASTTISATLTGTAPFNLMWSDGFVQTISSGTTASRSVTPSSTTTYTITTFSDANCTGTSSGSATVTVNPLPLVNIAGPAATCASTPVTLDAGGGFASYSWSTGETTQTITVTPASTQTYSVTVFDGSGCSGSDTHTVTVSANPTATIAAPAAVCQSSTGNAASVASQPGATYNWTITNGTITSATNTNAITFTAGASGNVILNVSVTTGSCTSTGSATIPTSAPPVVAITGPTQTCPNSSVTLDAGAGFTSYLWSTGATTPAITVAPNATTTYSVTVTNAAGCASTANHTVTLVSGPGAIEITSPATVTPGETNLTASVPSIPGATYVWTLTDGTIDNGQGTNSITFTAGGAGLMTIGVTVTLNGCTSTDGDLVTVTATPTGSEADLAVTKSGPSSAQAGATLTYTIVATNHGPDPVTDAVLTDTFPVGLTFVSVDGGAWTCFPFGTGVQCNGALSQGASNTVTITVTAPQQSGTITNSVTIAATPSDPNGANNDAAATTTIVAAPPECATIPPSPIAPANNATVTSPVAFEWSAVSGAIEYELWIDATLAGTTTSTSLTKAVSSGTSPWFVIARLGDGCDPLVSATRTFTVSESNGCDTHIAPQLTSPSGAIVDSPATFTWTPVPQAIGYRLWIEVDGTAPQDIGTTDGAISLIADLPAGSIVAYVDALFSGCPPTRSASIEFSVPAPDPCTTRAAAQPTSPPNDAILNFSSITFKWLAASGAEGYRVWYSLDGSTPAVLGTTTSDTELHATIDHGVVIWWIESLYPGCASTESTRFRFTVPQRSECTDTRPDPVAPAHNTTVDDGNVSFQWTAVPGAINYELWLSVNNGTPTLLGTTEGTSLTRVVPPGSLRWFIRAIVDRCPSRDSQTSHFTHQPPANCADNRRPLAIAPIDGAQTTAPIDFAWHVPDEANRFELFIVRGNNAPVRVAATTASQVTGINLTTGKLRWFVRALFDDCSPLDSVEHELEIVPQPDACAELASPLITAPGQISSGVPFLVQWTPIAGATAYQLQLASDGSFVGAETIITTATQHELTRTNTSTAPLAVHARVRAIDGNCTPIPSIGSYGPSAAIFILPAGGSEGATPLTGGLVTFTLQIGAEFAGQTFTATTKEPWLTVSPAAGVVGAAGTTLTATADTDGLPPGTSLGAITITLTSPASGNVQSSGTTITIPTMSISLVTPVTPTPKSTPPPDALIIPAVAHADGINSRFQSDVRVSNTSPQVIKYQLTFTPSGGDGIATGKQTTFSIEPGRTIALDDILKSWFGTGSDSAVGTLEIRPLTQTTTSTSSAAFAGLANLVTFASSRTFNMTSNGTFGQYIPAIPFANFIGRVDGVAKSVLSLQQIAQSADYRTNLGLVEGSGQNASLLVKVFGEGGQKLTEFPVNLTGGQHVQLNGFLSQHGINSLSDGRVEVEVISPGGKVTAYASVLDNNTSDPLLVSPVTLTDAGNTKWVMPGVADLNNGFANWQTDMRVFNAGTEPVDATFTFYSQAGGAPKTATFTIPAGQVKQFDKTLASLFGVTNDGGAVHITTNTSARLIATARTYNQTTGGTYGQFISAITPLEAAAVGTRPLQLLQVEESNRFRSNVGLAEVSGNPVKVEISVVPPDAKFTAVTELTLQANEFRQLGSLLKSVGLGDTFNARVTVRAIEGTGRVTAYASVIDAITNDPTLIPAQ